METLSIELVPGSPPVLRVAGELDLSTAERLGTALDTATERDPAVIIDLEGVRFVDAAGLRVILQAAARRNGDGPLTLVNASRVAWLLDLVGLDGLPSINLRNGS